MTRACHSIQHSHSTFNIQLRLTHWSWASSTSRPIPFPTAAFTSITPKRCMRRCRWKRTARRSSTSAASRRGPARSRWRRRSRSIASFRSSSRSASAARFRSRSTRAKRRWPKKRFAAGANIVNDVSGMRYSAGMPAVVAGSGVPVILMHMRGEPATMQDLAVYDDVVARRRPRVDRDHRRCRRRRRRPQQDPHRSRHRLRQNVRSESRAACPRGRADLARPAS